MIGGPDRLVGESRVPGGKGVLPGSGVYLVFLVGQELYAIEVGSLAEVLRHRRCTSVPAAGPSVHGVFFFRGTCVTVFDLAWKLAGKSSEPARSSRIVVLREPRWAAFLVDRVVALTSGEQQASVPSLHSSETEGPAIVGRLVWNNRPLRIVDVPDLVASEEIHGAGLDRARLAARNLY